MLALSGTGKATQIQPGNPSSDPESVKKSIKETLEFAEMVRTRNDVALKKIGPSKSDREAFKLFLKGPRTGITRLTLPVPCSMTIRQRIKDSDKFVRECPTQYVKGNGSNFSFRLNDYVSAALADLTINGRSIYSAGVLSQGIMVGLGDVQMENISPSSEGVKYLFDFVPAKTLTEAEVQMNPFDSGLTIGKYLYSRAFKPEQNRTFALRVVAYRATWEPPFLDSNGSFSSVGSKDPFYYDERKDIIVVFRIVRIEMDGSVTLIWRELNRIDSPKLKVHR